MRIRLWSLLWLFFPYLSHGAALQLDCQTDILLRNMGQKYLENTDATFRRYHADSKLPVPFKRSEFLPSLILKYALTDQIFLVNRDGGPQVLRHFSSDLALSSFVARLSQFKERGINVSEILDTDRRNHTVALKHYTLFSPHWVFQNELPDGLWSHLVRARLEFSQSVNDVASRWGLANGRIDSSNMYLDLETGNFILLDLD